jgi:hypothetical protein
MEAYSLANAAKHSGGLMEAFSFANNDAQQWVDGSLFFREQ